MGGVGNTPTLFANILPLTGPQQVHATKCMARSLHSPSMPLAERSWSCPSVQGVSVSSRTPVIGAYFLPAPQHHSPLQHGMQHRASPVASPASASAATWFPGTGCCQRLSDVCCSLVPEPPFAHAGWERHVKQHRPCINNNQYAGGNSLQAPA